MASTPRIVRVPDRGVKVMCFDIPVCSRVALAAVFLAVVGQPFVSSRAQAAAGELPVDPEVLPRLWRPVANPDPMPALELPPRAAWCAVVAFTIAVDGRPSDLVIVASNPDPSYGEAAKRVIEHRRYAPGRDNPDARSVETFEIVTFGPRRGPHRQPDRARRGSSLVRAL